MTTAADMAEVTVRLGATLLQVSRVRPGGCYRVGTAPGVDLAVDVAPLTSFPLVGSTPAGFVVRCPAGVAALVGGATVEGALVLARDAAIELALGQVSIAIALVDAARAPLGRPAIHARPLLFAAVSLAAHVAVLIVALAQAELDPVRVPVGILAPERRPATIARFVARPAKPKPVPRRPVAPAAEEAPPAPGRTHVPAAGRAREAASSGRFGSGAFDDLSAITGGGSIAAAFDGVGPVYDERAAHAGDFGNSGGRFDPTKDPAFASIEAGRYATIASGRGAGAHYDLPGATPRPRLMALTCDDADCVVAGAMNRFGVRDVIEKQYVALVRCYEPLARSVPRIELTVHFEIAPAGEVTGLRVDGHERLAPCVARIVGRARFAAADVPTRVSYPMAFWRTTDE